jgi:hypothetical protein
MNGDRTTQDDAGGAEETALKISRLVPIFRLVLMCIGM